MRIRKRAEPPVLKKGKYPKGQSGRVSCQARREISIRHQQGLKKQFAATRLLRHVARIEATPHSSNQVNTGIKTQVNTGVRGDSAREFSLRSRPLSTAKPPSTVSSSSATAASKPLPAWQYPPTLVLRPSPPQPPDALYDPPSPSPSQSQPPPASTDLSEPSCPPQKSQAIVYPSPDAAKRSRTEMS